MLTASCVIDPPKFEKHLFSLLVDHLHEMLEATKQETLKWDDMSSQESGRGVYWSPAEGSTWWHLNQGFRGARIGYPPDKEFLHFEIFNFGIVQARWLIRAEGTVDEVDIQKLLTDLHNTIKTSLARK